MAKVQGKACEIVVEKNDLLLSIEDDIHANGVHGIGKPLFEQVLGTTFYAEITWLKQWECPVHGPLHGYEALVFGKVRPEFSEMRQYCVLCWEDALRAAGVNELRLVQADGDAEGSEDHQSDD